MSLTALESDRLIRSGPRGWLLLYACWSVPVLAITSGIYAVTMGAGQEASLPVLVLREGWYYYFFASLCPLVYRAVVRFPLQRKRWAVPLGVHAAIAGTAVSLAMVLAGLVNAVFADSREGLVASVKSWISSAQGRLGGLVCLVTYLLVLAAMVFIRVSRQRQRHKQEAADLMLQAARLETQLERATLRTLEGQLQPHFLFNALNSVASLVEHRRNEEAYQAIAILGDLLRHTIGSGESRHSMTPLHEEMAFQRRYLELERLRFGSRLRTGFRVAPDCTDLVVPSMILQPLVENSIHHAVSKTSERCSIEIAGYRTGTGLALEVRDDGPGLPAGWTLLDGRGVGLDNVQRRLEVAYGEAFQFRVGPNGDRGVRVQLHLPLATLRPEGCSA